MEFKMEELSEDVQQQPEEPYATPYLMIHGDVDKITKYVAGEPTDAFQGSQLG